MNRLLAEYFIRRKCVFNGRKNALLDREGNSGYNGQAK